MTATRPGSAEGLLLQDMQLSERRVSYMTLVGIGGPLGSGAQVTDGMGLGGIGEENESGNAGAGVAGHNSDRMACDSWSCCTITESAHSPDMPEDVYLELEDLLSNGTKPGIRRRARLLGRRARRHIHEVLYRARSGWIYFLSSLSQARISGMFMAPTRVLY
ncbi:hypothetical protein GGF46_002248 [Coemansia sp. RSA 552]|nr:hypothetical protein GGF46_002248 [Coemansia sp. RSA 552]